MSITTKKTRALDLSCDRGQAEKNDNTVESAISIDLLGHHGSGGNWAGP